MTNFLNLREAGRCRIHMIPHRPVSFFFFYQQRSLRHLLRCISLSRSTEITPLSQPLLADESHQGGPGGPHPGGPHSGGRRPGRRRSGGPQRGSSGGQESGGPQVEYLCWPHIPELAASSSSQSIFSMSSFSEVSTDESVPAGCSSVIMPSLRIWAHMESQIWLISMRSGNSSYMGLFL